MSTRVFFKCPFCEKKKAFMSDIFEGRFKKSFVVCGHCLARGPLCDSNYEAGKGWNKRERKKRKIFKSPPRAESNICLPLQKGVNSNFGISYRQKDKTWLAWGINDQRQHERKVFEGEDAKLEAIRFSRKLEIEYKKGKNETNKW